MQAPVLQMQPSTIPCQDRADAAKNWDNRGTGQSCCASRAAHHQHSNRLTVSAATHWLPRRCDRTHIHTPSQHNISHSWSQKSEMGPATVTPQLGTSQLYAATRFMQLLNVQRANSLCMRRHFLQPPKHDLQATVHGSSARPERTPTLQPCWVHCDRGAVNKRAGKAPFAPSTHAVALSPLQPFLHSRPHRLQSSPAIAATTAATC